MEPSPLDSGTPVQAGPQWGSPLPPPPRSSVAPERTFPEAPPTGFGPEPGTPASQPVNPLANPMFSPPPSSTPQVTPSTPPDGRRGRWWPALLAGLIIGGLLTAGGFWLGQNVGDDEPVETALPAVESEDSPVAAPTVSIVPSETAEPVAAVAAAVTPSVVGIRTDFGEGSGISWTDDMVITNAHVVGESTVLTVLLPDGRELSGTVVGKDDRRDVAVVEVDQAILTPAVFAESDSVEVGQLAVAVGSPFGLDQSVTAGIVSALNRIVPNDLNGASALVAMVQTDAPINPGNSGGALADREGRVVGMNTSIRTAGGVNASVGVGFAVPSDTVLLIAERIVNGQSLDTGFLGVSLQNSVTDPVGALVTEVTAGTAAEGAGIEAGDVIVRVEEARIESTGDLAAQIQIRNPGESVEIELVRDGENLVVIADLGSN